MRSDELAHVYSFGRRVYMTVAKNHLGNSLHEGPLVGLATGLALTFAWAIFAGQARAADTVETFDAGAADFELYAGADGLGLPPGERRVFGEVLLGFGVIDRVSLYLRGVGAADEQLGAPNGEIGAGLFGTPLDGDHVDVDVLLDFGWGAEALVATPGFELNLDGDPDQASFGTYLRGEEALTSRIVEPDDAVAGDTTNAGPDAAAERRSHELAAETTLTLGTYCTVVDGHQILVEADGTILNREPASDEHLFDFGGVALGYNVTVHEAIELVNQVFIGIPTYEGDVVSAGLSVGLIATVPTGAAPQPDEERAARRRATKLSRQGSAR